MPVVPLMDINWDALHGVFVVLITGSVGGAISGAFVANYFTNQRDRKRRRIVLLGFLNVWASEVDANRKATSPHNVKVGIVDQFDERRLALIEKATPVEFDLSGAERTKFKELVAEIQAMTPGGVEREGKDNLRKAIGGLISFLEEN